MGSQPRDDHDRPEPAAARGDGVASWAMATEAPPADSRALEALATFVADHAPLLAITGAGCSTASGIPDYRDENGEWKHRRPVVYADFVASETVRRRYWARSLVGWPRVAEARPNGAHRALRALEAGGVLGHLLTQNVDGLHQKAGSRRVVDLHGRLDEVSCLACDRRLSRQDVQELLLAWNPGIATLASLERPDGDVSLEPADLDGVRVPDCPGCGGVLKPAVVFFGENVPRERVSAAMARLAEARGVLVVGSSLMVFSAYRFCLAAAERGLPVAALNLGRTRVDAQLAMKVHANCASLLPALVERLGLGGGAARHEAPGPQPA